MERGEARAISGVGVGLVMHRTGGEEQREQRPGALHPRGRPSGLDRRFEAALEPQTAGFEAPVGGVVQPGEGRQASGHRERIPRERAGLIHRTEGRDVAEVRSRTAICADREAAADDLPEAGQIRAHPDDRLRAAAGEAESGDDLVEDEQRAGAVGDLAESGEEAGAGRDAAHVAGVRLDDDRGERDRRRNGVGRGEIVVRRGPRVAGGRPGDTR